MADASIGLLDPTMGLAILLAGLVILSGLESSVHRRRLMRIPVRIHVNGTRGKSSVTRLIAAGLRAAGIRTFAKTTGTLPRIILPDGQELAIHRGSKPNVLEQVRTVALAAKLRCQALVVECMAVQPELQWLSERHLLRATHGIITNVRPDHLDAMGPTVEDVGLALAGMTPRNGALFTAEPLYLEPLRRAAQERGSRLVAVTADQVASVGPDILARFRYIEHAENVALALEVCAGLGVDRPTALSGMWTCQPDPGALTIHRIHLQDTPIMFINGFAANDPASTGWLWDWAIRTANAASSFEIGPRRVLVVNCRRDRIERSLQLAAACAEWAPADAYLLVGTGTLPFAREANRHGLDPEAIEILENRGLHEIAERIVQRSGSNAVVVGIGNIGGIGLELTHYFQGLENVSDREVAAVGLAA